jgi:endonuclease YncB( thermonuclease family)
VKLSVLTVPTIICALSSSVMTASAEVVLLKSGETLEGDIIVYHNRGVLLRESKGSPGRYYAFEEIRRITTKDGMLWYLMPRAARPAKESHFGGFPLTRMLTPHRKRVAPVPYLIPPRGDAVEVTCEDAEDAVTIRLQGGARVRLLGLDPPPKWAGRSMERRATEYLSSRVKGKPTLLFPGPQSSAAGEIPESYVVVDKSLVNAGMLENGWATAAASPHEHPYREAFLSLQKYAITLQRGIWPKAPR